MGSTPCARKMDGFNNAPRAIKTELQPVAALTAAISSRFIISPFARTGMVRDDGRTVRSSHRAGVTSVRSAIERPWTPIASTPAASIWRANSIVARGVSNNRILHEMGRCGRLRFKLLIIYRDKEPHDAALLGHTLYVIVSDINYYDIAKTTHTFGVVTFSYLKGDLRITKQSKTHSSLNGKMFRTTHININGCNILGTRRTTFETQRVAPHDIQRIKKMREYSRVHVCCCLHCPIVIGSAELENDTVTFSRARHNPPTHTHIIHHHRKSWVVVGSGDSYSSE